VLGSAPDAELIRRAAEGDRAALEVLLRRHQALIHKICRRLCGNDADALDATQEALIAVARRIDRFDGRAAFTTWLYRVTTNACLDELRRRRRRPQPTASATDPSHPADVGGSADRAVSQIENDSRRDLAEVTAERIDLDRALAELPFDFRVAVVLRDLLGLDYAEIGEVLEIPPGTVRSRIARGRSHLARRLDAEKTGNPVKTEKRPTADQPPSTQSAPEASS
jgi:RNA polymerase sigma-70 factor (ECF subfamily)